MNYLNSLEDLSVYPVLMNMLCSDDRNDRKISLEAMRNYVSLWTSRSLEHLGDGRRLYKELFPVLLQTYNSEKDPEVKCRLVRTIGAFGPTVGLEFSFQVLSTDLSPIVRLAALDNFILYLFYGYGCRGDGYRERVAVAKKIRDIMEREPDEIVREAAATVCRRLLGEEELTYERGFVLFDDYADRIRKSLEEGLFW